MTVTINAELSFNNSFVANKAAGFLNGYYDQYFGVHITQTKKISDKQISIKITVDEEKNNIHALTRNYEKRYNNLTMFVDNVDLNNFKFSVQIKYKLFLFFAIKCNMKASLESGDETINQAFLTKNK